MIEWSGSGLGNNNLFVLGDDGRILNLDFNPASCTVNFELTSPNQAFTHFAVDRAGKYLTACTSHGTVRMYDLGVSRTTATAVKDARRRMGMSTDQIEMALHTR